MEIGVKKGSATRVVVFSERVGTLHWLQENLTKHLRLPQGAVEVIHGGLPDLHFEPLSGPHRPVAVYLDGAAYHISESVFRVHGHVDKRSRLASNADLLIPWSLTSADLDRFQELPAERPGWMPEHADQLVRENPLLDSRALELLDSPVELLLAYLAQPDDKRWAELAHAAAVYLVANSASRRGDDVFGTFGQITLRTAVLGGRLRARHLHLQAANAGDLSLNTWNSFLMLANLMWLSPDQLTVTSSTGPAPSAKPETAPAATGVPQEWQEIFAEYDGEPEVEHALEMLVGAGARATDVIGEETASSMSVLTWPQQQIVLLFSEDADAPATDTLRSQGWRVLHADTLTEDDVPADLTRKA